MAKESVTLQHASPADGGQAKMDAMLGYLLLIGVVLSMTLIAAGLIWNYLQSGHLWLDYRLTGMNLFQLVWTELGAAAKHPGPRGLIDLGIIALMFTPYLRVVASMVYFIAVLKNWKYSMFTAIVLAVLTFSLFIR